MTGEVWGGVVLWVGAGDKIQRGVSRTPRFPHVTTPAWKRRCASRSKGSFVVKRWHEELARAMVSISSPLGPLPCSSMYAEVGVPAAGACTPRGRDGRRLGHDGE